MKHILVVRGNPDSPSFTRSDKFGNQWVRHNLDGQPLRAVIPVVVEDINEAQGNIGVTISSCRTGAAFYDPDAACIPSGVGVTVMAPIDPYTTSSDGNALRLWTAIHWGGPDHPPALGVKIRQKMLGDWVSSSFSDEQLEAWGRPKGALRSEIWLRPKWDAPKMFPQLFGIKEDPVITAITEKPQLASISFSPRTRWRVIDMFGDEVMRGIKTKEEAIEEMNKYTSSLK